MLAHSIPGHMTVDRILTLITVLATVAAAFFALRAAVEGKRSAAAGEQAAATGERAAIAGENAVTIAQKVRRQEQADGRIRQLYRVEEVLLELDPVAKNDAQSYVQGSEVYWRIQERLKFALVGIPASVLPTCRQRIGPPPASAARPGHANQLLPGAFAELEAQLKNE